VERSEPVQACNAANMCDFCETSATPVFHSTPTLKCQRHGDTRRLAVTAGIKNLSFWHRYARHVIRSVLPTRHVIRSVLPTRPLPIQSYLYVTSMLILSINFLRTFFKFMECVCSGTVI
jgi:hypothetical protein